MSCVFPRLLTLLLVQMTIWADKSPKHRRHGYFTVVLDHVATELELLAIESSRDTTEERLRFGHEECGITCEMMRNIFNNFSSITQDTSRILSSPTIEAEVVCRFLEWGTVSLDQSEEGKCAASLVLARLLRAGKKLRFGCQEPSILHALRCGHGC